MFSGPFFLSITLRNIARLKISLNFFVNFQMVYDLQDKENLSINT